MRSRWMSAASALVVFMALWLGTSKRALANGDLPHRGAFTCDFELRTDPHTPPDAVAGLIDHDRQLMSSADAAEGFKHKVIPLFNDPTSGKLFSGGRYLFDQWEQARSYEQFVTEDFYTVDPGTGQVVQFLQRSSFANPDCRSWYVVGAAEFADFKTTQYHVRSERWAIPSPIGIILFLTLKWPQVKAAAQQIPGVSAVWLLVNRAERLVSVVYFQNRLAPYPTAGLDQLLSAPSVVADYAAAKGWTQVSMAGHLALNIWLPFAPGDHGPAALWPNADAIPLVPSTSDGVCSPSRGETSANDSACLATCGNAVCEVGEEWLNCPADVSPYRIEPVCVT